MQGSQSQQPHRAFGGGYKGGEEMPLLGYAGLLGLYNMVLASLLLTATKFEHRLPKPIRPADLLLLSIATYKLSRLISKDRVTSPLRAPFTEYEGPAGTSEVQEKSRGVGMQRAIGDLLLCPWCMSPWVATTLVFGFLLKPHQTRLLGSLFTIVTVADLLQHAYEIVKKKAE